jgi:hypothetical protein
MSDDFISVSQAARLNGDAYGTYSTAIAHHLSMGKREGKDRLVSFWETVALRTLTELTSAKLNLDQAAQRVRALSRFIRRTAEGRLGGGKQYVFAIEAWGLVESQYKRAGHICEGTEKLSECIAALAKGGWPNMRVINLTNIVAETAIGWSIATQGLEIAAAQFRAELAGTAEDKAVALQLFEQIAARLESRERRPALPMMPLSWKPWGEVAAAA